MWQLTTMLCGHSDQYEGLGGTEEFLCSSTATRFYLFRSHQHGRFLRSEARCEEHRLALPWRPAVFGQYDEVPEAALAAFEVHRS